MYFVKEWEEGDVLKKQSLIASAAFKYLLSDLQEIVQKNCLFPVGEYVWFTL